MCKGNQFTIGCCVIVLSLIMCCSLQAQRTVLSVIDGRGWTGTDSNIVSVELENSIPVQSIQFHIRFDTNSLRVSNVTRTDRTEHLAVFNWVECGDGIRVNIAGEDTNIPAGSGSIANITIDISEDAVKCRKLPLILSHVKIDDLYERGAYQIKNGSFCVNDIPEIIPLWPFHDFGLVGIGCASHWTYAFCSTETWEPECCDEPIDSIDFIVQSAITDHPDFWVTSPEFPQTKSPGECIDITITFTPSREGYVTGTLMICTDDPDEPISQIFLYGSGTPYIFIPEVCDASDDSSLTSINMNNARNITTGQWDFVFDRNRMTITSISPTEQSLSMDILNYSDIEGGIRFSFADMDGRGIEEGSGPIFKVQYDLHEQWSCGDSLELGLEGVTLGDTADSHVPVIVDDGWLFFWSKGDVNLDCEINVLDVVQGVRIILGAQDPQGCREWAADFNDDGIIEVTDIIQIVNEIIGLDETPIVINP